MSRTLLVTLLTLALTPAAQAATVGSSLTAAPTGVPAPCPAGAARCVDVLERTAGAAEQRVPAGVVTAWRLRAPAQPDVSVSLRVGDAVTAPVTVRGGSVEAFPARLPVAAGGRLALDAPRQLGVTASATGARHVAAGAVREDEELLLQATVEPDADGDGFGDETQDGCPEDSTRQACSADLTAAAPDAVPVAAAGRAATLLFTVRNAGPDRAEGIVATAAGGHIERVAGCAGTRCALPALAPGEQRTVEVDVVLDDEGTATVRLDVGSAATDAAAATATGTARFVPQSVAPAPYALPAPACASVRLGSREDDVLEGTAFGDTLRGLEGRDLLRGGGAGDCLEGGTGSDVLAGGPGGDRLLGGLGGDRMYGDDGDDVLKGGVKNDVLFGGPGNDQLYAGTGADRLQGGLGNDLLNARDGVRERVDCGPGSDRAIVDRRDRVTGCERVERK